MRSTPDFGEAAEKIVAELRDGSSEAEHRGDGEESAIADSIPGERSEEGERRQP
jgi:hypothetical protein